MGKNLVAYFSASGMTTRVAQLIAQETEGDLYEIQPEVPYQPADLEWTDKQARSTVEMADPDCRPALADTNANIADYDTIFIGFPIWWYREPSIIDSFLDAYDFSGKTIVPFCTSGGTGIADASKRIAQLAGEKVTVLPGERFAQNVEDFEIETWYENLR